MSWEEDLVDEFGNDPPSAGWQFDYACEWCDATRLHLVMHAWDTYNDPEMTFESRPVLREGTMFILAACSRCEAPLLLAWQPNVDVLWHVTTDDLVWQQLWPLTKSGIDRPEGCPQPAIDLLNQAIACQAVSPTAAVLLTRKAVEVVTASLGFKGNLGSSLRKMRSQGAIDGRLWAWSDLLRQVGNRGAHDLEGSVSVADADDATWFAKELIHQVFVVQPRFESFASRHPSAASPDLRLLMQEPKDGPNGAG